MLARADLSPAFPKDNVPVVFAVDEMYVPYLAVALLSILRRLSGNLDALIIVDGLEKRRQCELVGRFADYPNCSIRFVDIHDYVENSAMKQVEQVRTFTRAASFRIAIPEMLVNYEKVLYLDTDIVCRHDLSQLFQIDLGDSWLGAVIDGGEVPMSQREFGSKNGFHDWDNYFNSGMLLMNARSFREQALLERLLEIVLADDRYSPDQNALNFVCHGHVLFLDRRWNVQAGYRDLLRKLAWHPYICHYTCQKPWHCPSCYLGNLWWEELAGEEYDAMWMRMQAHVSSGGNSELLMLRKEVDALRNSEAYRAGMVVTWPAKKMVQLVMHASAWLRRRG